MISSVVKIGPDRPVRPVGPVTDLPSGPDNPYTCPTDEPDHKSPNQYKTEKPGKIGGSPGFGGPEKRVCSSVRSAPLSRKKCLIPPTTLASSLHLT